jgi:chaperone BCS1
MSGSRDKTVREGASPENGDHILQMMNNPLFKEICATLKSKSGGRFDVTLFMAACVTANAARTTVPAMLATVFEHLKTNVTSSLRIPASDQSLQEGLRQMARDTSTTSGSAWYKFHGQHEESQDDGSLKSLPGGYQNMFKHGNRLFILEESARSLTVRCFGHSNGPILDLCTFVRQQQIASGELDVYTMDVGSEERQIPTPRSKRLLSTIDLDPVLMSRITNDAKAFFGEHSREWYRSTGTALYGSPGTGKTSLSVAIASHLNVPLVLITLQDMDDTDLMTALGRLPARCVVLLEDIDCAGADVEDCNAENNDWTIAKDQDAAPEEPDVSQHELLQLILQQQALSNQKILDEIASLKDSSKVDEWGMSNDHADPELPQTAAPVATNKRISLSGLLNVIDGADAPEGRLLIMTTNCPEKLDPALTRAGRCDEKFKIDFATKVTSEQTFKRIFGLDKESMYKPETLDRFAKAFSSQFPVHSKVSTAELAKYCSRYRTDPKNAVEDFPEWLEIGDGKFTYRVARESMDEEATFNVPGSFDPALLHVTSEDFADPNTIVATTTSEPLTMADKPPSTRQPSTWYGAIATDRSTINCHDLPTSGSPCSSTLSVLDGLCRLIIADEASSAPSAPQPDRQAQVSALYASLGCGPRGSKQNDYYNIDIDLDDLDDTDMDDLPSSSLESCISPTMDSSGGQSLESPWDAAHHDRARPIRSATSVKFAETDNLARVASRPFDGFAPPAPVPDNDDSYANPDRAMTSECTDSTAEVSFVTASDEDEEDEDENEDRFFDAE